MTRLLSQLLGAREPDFYLRVHRFERSSGHPNADIHLSAALIRRVQSKIREIGLDPQDTTGPELYHVLGQRLQADEQRLREVLGVQAEAASADVLSAAQQFIARIDIPRGCFALKTSATKRLLKAQPPKKAMKALGYRSLDSMLKHEPVAALYAAALIYESVQWQRCVAERYRQLTPGDFEVRTIALIFPKAKRWESVAKDFAERHHHISVAFKELGAVVTLPVAAQMPALALTSVLLLLDNINDIRCSSAFLKLQQVRPNFGQSVVQVVQGEPSVVTELTSMSGTSLPWRTLQYYYHKVSEAYHPALFEPHVQPEDLALAEAEHVLAQAVPALEFWQDTADLALLDNGQTISLNMLDVALNVANRLAFEERIVHYARQNILTQLILDYLKHHRNHQHALNLEESIASPSLVMEESHA